MSIGHVSCQDGKMLLTFDGSHPETFGFTDEEIERAQRFVRDHPVATIMGSSSVDHADEYGVDQDICNRWCRLVLGPSKDEALDVGDAAVSGHLLSNGATVLLAHQIEPHLDVVLCTTSRGELVTWVWNRDTGGACHGTYHQQDAVAAACDFAQRAGRTP